MRQVKRTAHLNLKVISIIVVLGYFIGQVVSLYLNQKLADQGAELVRIESLNTQLKLENTLLRNKIASDSSLRAIEIKAYQLGIKSNATVEYLP